MTNLAILDTAALIALQRSLNDHIRWAPPTDEGAEGVRELESRIRDIELELRRR